MVLRGGRRRGKTSLSAWSTSWKCVPTFQDSQQMGSMWPRREVWDPKDLAWKQWQPEGGSLPQEVEGHSAPFAPVMTTLRAFVQRGLPLAEVKWKRARWSLTEGALYVRFAAPGIIGWNTTTWRPQTWQPKGDTPLHRERRRERRVFLVNSPQQCRSQRQQWFRRRLPHKGQASQPPKEGISFEGL